MRVTEKQISYALFLARHIITIAIGTIQVAQGHQIGWILIIVCVALAPFSFIP